MAAPPSPNLPAGAPSVKPPPWLTEEAEELRSMVFLVETAMSKKPPERTLGGPSGLLFPASLADGHVSYPRCTNS